MLDELGQEIPKELTVTTCEKETSWRCVWFLLLDLFNVLLHLSVESQQVGEHLLLNFIVVLFLAAT